MINRPATRIELKLEDDISEYEEMCEIRRNNTEMQQSTKTENILNDESSFNSIKNAVNIQHQNLMKNNLYINNFDKKNNDEDNLSKSSDVSMKENID